AMAAGRAVLTGRASEEARLPMGPLADAVRRWAGGAEAVPSRLAEHLRGSIADGIVAENASHLIALSMGLRIPDARVRELDPQRLQAESLAAWDSWLRSLGNALLCVEDLHWADPDSIHALERAATHAPPGLSILATARPNAIIPAGFSAVPLHPVSLQAIGAIAARVLESPVSGELAAWIAARADGNPFVAEELARFLRAERLIHGDPARLASAPTRIPPGLQGLLVARLDALPAAAKDALKAASVVGSVFWPSVAGVPEEDIEEAARRGLVDEAAQTLLPGEREFLFRHALLREAALSLLPKRVRARRHAEAAARLEARAADVGRTALILAAAQ
ncbi:MAG: Large transcriptional regulator, partial [Elusimicrobia bacterium]